MRVLVAAGGTGGHVYPALAVAGVLRDRGHDVRFSGGRRIEARLVPEAGFPLHVLPARGLPRRPSVEAVRAAGDLMRAIAGARRLLRAEKIEVVLSMGGYDSLAPALAAGWRKIPVVLHEQNANLSLAHRLAAPWGSVLATSLPLDRAPRRPRVELTGNPLRPAVRELAVAGEGDRAARRRSAAARFGMDPSMPAVMAVGGSQGAAPLNEAAVTLRQWAGRRGVQILHVSGPAYEQDARRAWGDAAGVRVFGYLDDIEEAYALADVVVARSGSSVTELTACGIPAVLVPSTSVTRGQQIANAAVLERAGAAIVVSQEGGDLGPRVRAVLDDLFNSETKRREMAAAARELGRPDAATTLADLIERASLRDGSPAASQT